MARNYDVPLRYLKRQFLQLAKMNTRISPEDLTLKQISMWEDNLYSQLALIDKIREIEYDIELSAEDEDDDEEENNRSHRFKKLRKRK